MTPPVHPIIVYKIFEVDPNNTLDAAEVGYEVGLRLVRKGHYPGLHAAHVEDFVREINRDKSLTPAQVADAIIDRFSCYGLAR